MSVPLEYYNFCQMYVVKGRPIHKYMSPSIGVTWNN